MNIVKQISQTAKEASPSHQSQHNKTQTSNQPVELLPQKSIKNRLILTDLGISLMREAEQEKEVIDSKKQREKKLRQQNFKQSQDESTLYIEGLLQDQNCKPSKNVTDMILLASMNNKKKGLRSMENLFEKNMTPDMKNSYIKQQVKKYSQQIMSDKGGAIPKNASQTNLIRSTIDNQFQTQNNMLSYIDKTNNIDLQLGAGSMLDDIYALDKYNKVLYAESKIDHIHRRYQAFEKQHNKIQRNVTQRYEQKYKHPSEGHQVKQMNLLDEIGKEHQDLVDILHRETMYGKRKQERNMEYMKHKFVKDWTRFKLPKLTQKSLENHQRFEKYQNRPIQ